MIVEQTSAAVITIRFDDVASGWEFWLLLRSDAHHDSPRCNQTLERKHLDQMKDRRGAWADFGDLFDAMQGKFDPRRSMDDLRPEDKRTDYYDAIVEHAADFYAPYADDCIMLGMGNHETAALKNANISLTANLVHRLNTTGRTDRSRILVGKYGGWLRFLFRMNKTKRQQVRLRYFHGAGGAAPVTKGVIQTNRQAVFLPDANLVINGHNHNAYILPLVRDRLTVRGRQYKDVQWHGRIPGYKDDYGDGTEGFAVEKGRAPTPLGSLWLHFTYASDQVRFKLIPEIE